MGGRWVNGWTDVRMDSWMDGSLEKVWKNGRTDGDNSMRTRLTLVEG